MAKYSPEKLAAMRSVGHLKSGRTKHNDAGVPIERTVSDTGEKRETVDHNNAVITEHRDGSQDVHLHPEPIERKMATN